MAQFDYQKYNGYTPQQKMPKPPKYSLAGQGYKLPTASNPLIPMNNPYKSIENYKTRLTGVGAPVPERDADGDGGLLNGVLRVLQMTGSASTNVIHDVVKGIQTPGKQNTLGSLGKSYVDSFTGKRQDTMTDVFDTMGWKADENPDGKWYKPWTWDGSNTIRNIATLGADIVVDPLSWVSFGALGLGKNVAKGVTKEALGKLATTQTGHIDDIATAIAKEFDTADFVLEPAKVLAQAMKVTKDKDQAELLMRTAYSLTKTSKATDLKTLEYLMDKGFNGLNEDIINNFAKSSSKSQEGIITGFDGMSELTKAIKSRSGSLSSALGKGLSGATGGANLYSAIKGAKSLDEFDTMVGGVKGVLEGLNKNTGWDLIPDWKAGMTKPEFELAKDEVRTMQLKRIYPNMDDAQIGTKLLDKTLDIRELDVLESLYAGFKSMDSTKLEILSKDIISFRYGKKAPKLDDARVASVLQRFDSERGLRSQVKELGDGIEFANGLQRAYDASKGRFFFRYHNPFNNKVLPIVELTNVAKNPAMKKAGEVAFGLPGIRQGRDILGYIFQPEYMGKKSKLVRTRNDALMKVDSDVKSAKITPEKAIAKRAEINDKFDYAIDARNDFAKKMSKYLHLETAIPYKTAESATNIFWDETHTLDKAFLKSETLMKGVSYYRQRNNSDASRVGWELLRGRELEDVLDEVMGTDDALELIDDSMLELAEASREILRQAFSDPKMQKFIKNNQVKDAEMEIIERASGKVTMYFGALKDFDETRGTIFSNVEQSDKSKGVFGFGVDSDKPIKNIVTPENYVHAVYKNTDRDTMKISSMDKSDVDNIKTNTSQQSFSADEKQIESMFDARIYGKEPVDNIIMSMALRNTESLRVDLNRRLVADIQNAIRLEPGFSSLINTKMMYGATPIKIGKDEFFAMPEVVNQLNRIVDTFSTNLGVAQLVSYMDNVTNAMKRLQTSLNPAFILRNAIGEPAMNFFDGVKAISWSKAVEVLTGSKSEGFVRVGDTMFHKGEFAYKNPPDFKAKPQLNYKQRMKADASFAKGLDDFLKNSTEPPRAGETPYKYNQRLSRQYARENSAVPMQPHESIRAVDPETGSVGNYSKEFNSEQSIREGIIGGKGISTITLGNNTYTHIELLNHFRDLGLGWSGVSKGNLIQNSSSTIRNEVAGQVGNPVLNAVANMGDGVETLTRLSHFIDKLDQGFGLEEAASAVRAYHVDYRDLTLPERNVFRRLAPYYTYMRKNLPIQVKNVYTNLGKVNMVSELVRSSYDAIEVNNNGNAPVTDDYLKEGLAIPLGIDPQGNVQYLNWNLPIIDIGRLRLDLGESFDMNILEMLHPAIKAAFEIPANTSLGFNQPIEQFQGQETPLLPGTDTFGIPKVANYFIQQLGVAESARKMLGTGYNALTGAEPDPMKPTQMPLFQSLVPVKNQYNTLNNQAYQYRDQLQEYVNYLEQEGLPVPSMAELEKMQYTPGGRKPKYSAYTPR